MPGVPEQEDVMPDADSIDRIVREMDPEGTNAPLRAWAEATKRERERGSDPFDPRAAALAKAERIQKIVGHVSERLASENAALERLVGEGAQAVAAGLVYVGDQIGRLGAAGKPQMAKSVKVVAVTARTALLEVDGEQHQVFAGESLRVQGLAGPEVVDPATYLPFLEARLVQVTKGGRARFTVGPSLFEVHLGETFRLYVDLAGRPDVQIERGYKEALERIANLDESFGDAPTDDRMRDIAVRALAAGER